MGVDWERLSLSGYFEALEAYNESESGGRSDRPSDLPRLRRFMEAHAG